jgi:hypothetical protein
MTSKFEQLIEYVINDEEAKAKELFHDIVVEKSREIYENLMQEEAEEIEEEANEELDEDAEEIEEGMGDIEEMGGTGDAAENFMDEVEVEEEGMMEGDDEEDHHDDMGGNEGLEDRVVDLEDKLDELMAEFEAMMDGEGDADMGAQGGDELEMDDTEEFSDMGGEEEEGTEEFELAEGIDLKAAPKPTTSEEGSVNKKNVVANNSGAAGMASKPVHQTGTEAKGRPAPTAKELGAPSTQEAGSKAFKTAAPKPVTTQAAGVNARTPFPKG